MGLVSIIFVGFTLGGRMARKSFAFFIAVCCFVSLILFPRWNLAIEVDDPILDKEFQSSADDESEELTSEDSAIDVDDLSSLSDAGINTSVSNDDSGSLRDEATAIKTYTDEYYPVRVEASAAAVPEDAYLFASDCSRSVAVLHKLQARIPSLEAEDLTAYSIEFRRSSGGTCQPNLPVEVIIGGVSSDPRH